ncbi:hypothetical protein TTHERM_00647010 (macronuclear) [Tetrahymena thermophila SB210]|uniref:Uncharacterized protein n=1 Tax=Tetrahymena thermophila (strain SB210) TaxID=312017 RepID=I7LY14_TETTS|nr:hypothetical protein TTHERM_00647010 [Tetrahymena thermophila SB210]EAS07168.1 hypothetical protein TTHERM_00647010 [Tetrahymena thermophila SB210]|eukprot:XP_001027410.1 hypothetical protein TTHERM_00647010 [Tetrahymena thermophila SB210]
MFSKEFDIKEPNQIDQSENKELKLQEYRKKLNNFYMSIFNDTKQYQNISHQIDKLYVEYKIVHNSFFIADKNVTWDFKNLFQKLKCLQISNKFFVQDQIKWNQSFSKQVNLTLRIVKRHDENVDNKSSKIGEYIILHFFDKNQLQPNSINQSSKQNIEKQKASHEQDFTQEYAYQKKHDKRQTNLHKYDQKFNEKNQQQMNQILATNQQQIVNKECIGAQKSNDRSQELQSNNNINESLQPKIKTKVEESQNQNLLYKEGTIQNNNNIIKPQLQKVNFVKEEYVQLSDKEKVELLQSQLSQQISLQQQKEQNNQYKEIQYQKIILKMKEDKLFQQNPNFNPQGLLENDPIQVD